MSQFCGLIKLVSSKGVYLGLDNVLHSACAEFCFSFFQPMRKRWVKSEIFSDSKYLHFQLPCFLKSRDIETVKDLEWTTKEIIICKNKTYVLVWPASCAKHSRSILPCS